MKQKKNDHVGMRIAIHEYLMQFNNKRPIEIYNNINMKQKGRLFECSHFKILFYKMLKQGILTKSKNGRWSVYSLSPSSRKFVKNGGLEIYKEKWKWKTGR